MGRSEIDEDKLETVCAHRYHILAKKIITLRMSKMCSDLFIDHGPNRRGLSTISLQLTAAIPALGLVPGERLCSSWKIICFKRLASPERGNDNVADSDEESVLPVAY